jgi:hypothetical protein
MMISLTQSSELGGQLQDYNSLMLKHHGEVSLYWLCHGMSSNHGRYPFHSKSHIHFESAWVGRDVYFERAESRLGSYEV